MIAITVHGAVADVRFRYDRTLLDVIRGVPGRRWNPTRKVWVVPSELVATTAALFTEFGETVHIDGRPYAPPALANSTISPVLHQLFAATPLTLRKALYRALATVYHPDHGGDASSMKALNEMWARRTESA